MTDENNTPTSIGWVRQHVERRLDDIVELLGAEIGDLAKAERERVDAQLRLFQRAVEIQANRIADLEVMIAAPKRSVASPAEKPTASLIAGRAS
jgi:hypothetical protein